MEKKIDPKYAGLVERFKAEPDTIVNEKKLIMKKAFKFWFYKNKKMLNEEERNYLQDNIARVDDI